MSLRTKILLLGVFITVSLVVLIAYFSFSALHNYRVYRVEKTVVTPINENIKMPPEPVLTGDILKVDSITNDTVYIGFFKRAKRQTYCDTIEVYKTSISFD